MKLLSDLYTYIWEGQDNNCNTFVFGNVLDGGRHLVIDPGHINTSSTGEPALERLLSEMKADGLQAEDIGMVLLTHCHPDHFESAGYLQENYQALVAIHEVEAAVYAHFGGNADFLLREGELKLGKKKPFTLNVIHSPGHSPGHATFYWPQKKVLIAGDVIFYQSTGRTDLPGGSPEQMKQSVLRLAEMDIEILLCGHPYGHPGILQGKKEVQENFEFLKQHIL